MNWYRRFEEWSKQDMDFTPANGTALLVGLFAIFGFLYGLYGFVDLVFHLL